MWVEPAVISKLMDSLLFPHQRKFYADKLGRTLVLQVHKSIQTHRIF